MDQPLEHQEVPAEIFSHIYDLFFLIREISKPGEDQILYLQRKKLYILNWDFYRNVKGTTTGFQI